MGRYRRGSIGMNKPKKRKRAVEDEDSDTESDRDRLLMPPPPPRLQVKQAAKAVAPASPGKKARRTLASLRREACKLMKECGIAHVNAYVEHECVKKWYDGRMIRLERELVAVAPERAWRVSDKIDSAMHRLKDSYKSVLEAEMNMMRAENEWWKCLYSLEAERSAMLRRRLRKRKVLGSRG